MKRILCATGSGGEIAGAERSLLNLIKHSPHKFVCVVNKTGPFEKSLREAGAEVHIRRLHPIARTKSPSRIIKHFFSLIRGGLTLWRIGRGCDLVLANKNVVIFHSVLAGFFLRAPVVWYVRNRAEKFGLVGKLLSLFVDGIIFVSRFIAEPFRGHFRRCRKIIVYEGINSEEFARRVQSYHCDPGTKVVVSCIGRITPWKGQDVFLECARILGDRYEYLIVGGSVGSPEEMERDRAFEKSLRQFAKHHNIPVTFIEFTHEVERYFAESDVIVLPSRGEPFGILALEAMSAGVPLVASRSGGLVEFLEDGETAVLVEEGKAEAFASAIRRLLDDDSLRERLVKNASQKVREFSLEAFSLKLSSFLDEF